MTPREYIKSIVDSHAHELKAMKNRNRVNASVFLAFYVIISPLTYHGWPEKVFSGIISESALIIIGYIGWLAVGAYFVKDYLKHRSNKKWLSKLRCPNCNADFAYFIAGSDYQDTAFMGIPDRIKTCPYCTLLLDEEYKGKNTEPVN